MATSALVTDAGGRCFEDCQQGPTDPVAAERLWEVPEELLAQARR